MDSTTINGTISFEQQRNNSNRNITILQKLWATPKFIHDPKGILIGDQYIIGCKKSKTNLWENNKEYWIQLEKIKIIHKSEKEKGISV